MSTFLVIASENDDLFSCHLTTPSSPVVYAIFFINLATKKILVGCHLLKSVTRGGPPLLMTPLRVRGWHGNNLSGDYQPKVKMIFLQKCFSSE